MPRALPQLLLLRDVRGWDMPSLQECKGWKSQPGSLLSDIPGQLGSPAVLPGVFSYDRCRKEEVGVYLQRNIGPSKSVGPIFLFVCCAWGALGGEILVVVFCDDATCYRRSSRSSGRSPARAPGDGRKAPHSQQRRLFSAVAREFALHFVVNGVKEEAVCFHPARCTFFVECTARSI